MTTGLHRDVTEPRVIVLSETHLYCLLTSGQYRFYIQENRPDGTGTVSLGR